MDAPPPVPSKSPHPLHQPLPQEASGHRAHHTPPLADGDERSKKSWRGPRSPTSPRHPWRTATASPTNTAHREHTSFDTHAQSNAVPFASAAALHSLPPAQADAFALAHPQSHDSGSHVTGPASPAPIYQGHVSHETHTLLSQQAPSTLPPDPINNMAASARGVSSGTSGQEGEQRLSHKLILALRSKPTLARSWEKRSFGEELRTAPLETSHNGNLAMSPASRPTSLYASPSALRSFRPLPHTAPASPTTHMGL